MIIELSLYHATITIPMLILLYRYSMATLRTNSKSLIESSRMDSGRPLHHPITVSGTLQTRKHCNIIRHVFSCLVIFFMSGHIFHDLNFYQCCASDRWSKETQVTDKHPLVTLHLEIFKSYDPKLEQSWFQ